MLQPFLRFDHKYLHRLLELKKYYLVTQTYTRGFDHFSADAINLLITEYDDAGLAKIHHNAVQQDPFAAMIFLNQPHHLHKMEEMLTSEKYRLFWSIVGSAEQLQTRLLNGFKPKIRKYLDTSTNWKISGKDKVSSRLEIIFGELFLLLKWRSQQLRVKFEEIEKA